MKANLKNVMSFGLTIETMKDINPEEYINIMDFSIGTWKSFFKKQSQIIRLIDNPITVLKNFGRKENKFFIEFPRSIEAPMLGAFKEGDNLATWQVLFRFDGTALLLDGYGAEASYGGAFQMIFKHLTGESILEKVGIKTEEAFNFWVLEQSKDFNPQNSPELFLGHYIK